jgi:dipeptidyl aminopeptidase/acylaminoacyl peptidase
MSHRVLLGAAFGIASRAILAGLVPLGPGATPAALAAERRPLALDDLYRLKEVRDPQRSPDGQWVAYTVTSVDREADKNDTDVWMVSWDGARAVRLTSSPDNETTPRWSPDGRYLSFLSSRRTPKDAAQLWLLDRAGGEAEKLTSVEGSISDYDWAPDGKRLVLAVRDPDPEAPAAGADAGKKRTAKPIVIDRYHFKQDIVGYLGERRTHLQLFDVKSRKAEPLTPGSSDEALPAWSPDGRSIAFVSKRGGVDADRDENWDVFVVEAQVGGVVRRLTTSPGEDNGPGAGRLAWSPDGSRIAYLQGTDSKYHAYNQHRLAVVPAAGGAPLVVTTALDRPVSSPQWSGDGSSLSFRIVDDRSIGLGTVPAAGGTIERVVTGRRVLSALSLGKDDGLAVLAATDTEPPEVHALEKGALRRLSHHNDWLGEIQLGTTEEFTSRSKDGTTVNGLVVKPAGFVAGRRYPTVLRIHGGPNGQDEHAFSFERELLAAGGYVVVAANYRGSNGRGEAYQRAIFADWGNKEVMDLLGAVDWAVAQGLADPARLGIGGWSYGGILTNYTIATDPRFKAATSGAGSSNQISMYGHDQYITQYENELGPPWRARDLWMKVSYPFFSADRIRTPTLFLGGEEDFNVPLAGGEQMYQALRSLGVPTQLVIYPGQYHGLTTPSYKRDRLERYVQWYDKYLKAGASAIPADATAAR